MSERLGHCHQLRIPAVSIAARGPKPFAEILFPAATEIAYPACGKDPGDADPLTGSEDTCPR